MPAIPISKLGVIDLGRQGENLARTVEIDIHTILEKWPDAIVSLLVKRKGDSEPYFTDTYVRDGILYWPITLTETSVVGEGKVEIHAVSGNVVAKSVSATIRVAASLSGSASVDPPDVHPSWVDDLMHRTEQKLNSEGYSPDIYLGTDEYGRVIEKPAPTIDVEAQNGVTFTPNISDDGLLTWTNDGNLPNPKPVDITGPQGLRGETGSPGPQGETGLSGSDGRDGVSPTISIENIVGGHRLHVSDSSGISSFDVLDGSDGQPGADGKDGSPGINWRGQWDDSISYAPYDAVEFEGSSYVYVGGKNPPNGISPIDYPDEWSLLAAKGNTGAAGQKGADGKTPVKGTDYMTAAEKSELIAQIKDSLPTMVITGIDTTGNTHTWTVYGNPS